MSRKLQFLLLALFALLSVFLPQTVSARLVPECNHPGMVGCNLCDFFLLIKNIFNFVAFQVAPPLAAFLFLIAGFLFLVSTGNESRVGQAKKIFTNVLIGLIILYAGWVVVGTLINTIGKSIEGFQVENWYKFNCNGS